MREYQDHSHDLLQEHGDQCVMWCAVIRSMDAPWSLLVAVLLLMLWSCASFWSPATSSMEDYRDYSHEINRKLQFAEHWPKFRCFMSWLSRCFAITAKASYLLLRLYCKLRGVGSPEVLKMCVLRAETQSFRNEFSHCVLESGMVFSGGWTTVRLPSHSSIAGPHSVYVVSVRSCFMLLVAGCPVSLIEDRNSRSWWQGFFQLMTDRSSASLGVLANVDTASAGNECRPHVR